jgi:uncharacterized protein YcfL
MNMRILILLLAMVTILMAGCSQQGDQRINARSEVGSDTLTNNIIIRPIATAFSALIGEGIVVEKAFTKRNDAGLLEVYVNGFNQSVGTKRFRYRVEWLDENGQIIETKTSVWMPMSAMGKQPFSFKVVAPRTEAVNFRMDTRKWED